jgi:hypothetical protein
VIRLTQYLALSYDDSMSRYSPTDPESTVQQRAEATVDRVARAIRLALAAGEKNLELQVLQLTGEAGEHGRNLLISAADRALVACQWPAIMLRPRQAPARLEMLGQAQDGDLIIWIELLAPSLARTRLTHRDTMRPLADPLYSVDIPMDSGLWEQIRDAR